MYTHTYTHVYTHKYRYKDYKLKGKQVCQFTDPFPSIGEQHTPTYVHTHRMLLYCNARLYSLNCSSLHIVPHCRRPGLGLSAEVYILFQLNTIMYVPHAIRSWSSFQSFASSIFACAWSMYGTPPPPPPPQKGNKWGCVSEQMHVGDAWLKLGKIIMHMVCDHVHIKCLWNINNGKA